MREAERADMGRAAAVRVHVLQWYRRRCACACRIGGGGGGGGDTELIRLCETFIARSRETCAVNAEADRTKPGAEKVALELRVKELSAGFHERMEEIAVLPARTLEGISAKARLIEQYWGSDPPADSEVAWSLVQDLLGRA